MPSVALSIDMEPTRRRLRYVRQNPPRATARALNRSRDSARTVMVRRVAADMNLLQRDIRDRIRTDDARPGRLRARMSAGLQRIPLIKFKATQFNRGVKATVQGGRKLYPGTFISRMSSGHEGVFKRRTKKRLPITELHGPSIGHVFEQHVDEATERGLEQLPKNLRHEHNRVLRQAARQ